MTGPLVFLLALVLIGGPIALLLGRKMSGDALAATRAYFVAARGQFELVRRPNELDPVWVLMSGTVHGALGATDQRLLFHTTTGFESVERRDITSFAATAKNYGGARHLWGHELTIEVPDRRYVLDVIDRADHLPAEHDVDGLLARLAS
jgi:hypothetical protein